MSYKRFDFSNISLPAATLATAATLAAEIEPTVANVAIVAGPDADPAVPDAQTVAVVATVAGEELKPALSPLPYAAPGIRTVAPARAVSACEYDEALDQLIAAAADPERTCLLRAKRAGACVEVNGEAIFTRGRM